MAGAHNKRKQAQLVEQRATSFVIVYLVAVVGEFGLRGTVAVLVAVENDFDPLGMKGFNLIENNDDPSIIGRVRDIKRNDVEKHGSAMGWANNFGPSLFDSAQQR